MFLELPTRPELYDLHEVLEPNPHFALLGQALRTDLVSRPSSVTGKKYENVAKVYIQAIHSVLTGEKSAPEAASSLEKQLVLITGFRKAPPPGTNRADPKRSPEPTR